MNIELTYAHSQSSGGVPVALLDGEACNAEDIVSNGEGFITVGQLVEWWAEEPQRSEMEREMARRFLFGRKEAVLLPKA